MAAKKKQPDEDLVARLGRALRDRNIRPGQLERALVKEPLQWFELHGCILDKKRRPLRFPELKGNDLQKEMNAVIRYCEEKGIPCRIINLKGRQQGSSTFSVATAYQQCQMRVSKCCIIGDEYEKSVKNLEAMFEDFAANDTFAWGNKFTRTNGKFSHGSILVTETANDPRAGASGTMQIVLATEVAHWKETGVISGKATFAALLNCVPEEPGTLMVVESTPNGTGGVYHSTYINAISLEDHKAGRIPETWNGFFKVFYPWHRHPEYRLDVTEEQAAVIEESLTERELELVEMELGMDRLAWRRKMIKSPRFDGDEELFEQEYPSDEDRCFLASGRRLFPQPAVQGMRRRAEEDERACGQKVGVLSWTDETKRRVKFEPCSEDDAFVRVWEMPMAGLSYNLPVDPMTGASGVVGADPDNHGAGILRKGYWDRDGVWKPLLLGARLADCWAEKRHKRGQPVCKWDIDVLTERVAMMATWYGGACVVVETNMDKGIIELMRAKYAQVLLYRRMMPNRVKQTMSPVYGWKTDVSTRAELLENLVRRVRLFQEPGDGIEVRDKRVVGELGSMIINPNGKAEAMGGHHDDQVLMLGIGAVTIEAAHMMAPERRGRAEWDSEEGGEKKIRDWSMT
jgi:hypothetical protein